MDGGVCIDKERGAVKLPTTTRLPITRNECAMCRKSVFSMMDSRCCRQAVFSPKVPG